MHFMFKCIYNYMYLAVILYFTPYMATVFGQRWFQISGWDVLRLAASLEKVKEADPGVMSVEHHGTMITTTISFVVFPHV